MNRYTKLILLSLLYFYPLWAEAGVESQKTPVEHPKKGITIHVVTRFDGYYQMATREYMTTIPVVRPTTQYAFMKVEEVLGGNWRPDRGDGLSIAIGETPLVDSDGTPLLVGQNYECTFIEIAENVYSANFTPTRTSQSEQ